VTVISEQRKGELCVLAAGVLWGLFPVVTNLRMQALTPLWLAAFSTLLAVIPLLIFGVWKRTLFVKLHRAGLQYILAAALINGVLFYFLIFLAMPHTSPQNASVLFLFEIATSIFFLHEVVGERLTWEQIGGAMLIVVAVIVIAWPKEWKFNLGDPVILIAMCLTPFGNWFSKKARVFVSSDVIILVRSLIAGIILLIVAFIIEPLPEISHIRSSALALFINGIFIMGIGKVIWNEGIARIPIAKATSLQSISPLVTYVASSVFLGIHAETRQLAALPIAIGGMMFLTLRKTG
jgi:drug/metabolite transporter (DMT)-like permease